LSKEKCLTKKNKQMKNLINDTHYEISIDYDLIQPIETHFNNETTQTNILMIIQVKKHLHFFFRIFTILMIS